jgi:hypothetical protein
VLTANQAVGDSRRRRPADADLDGANAWIAAQHAKAAFAPIAVAGSPPTATASSTRASGGRGGAIALPSTRARTWW